MVLKFSFNRFVKLLTILLTISYVGILAGYKACTLLALFLILSFIIGIILKHIKSVSKNRTIFLWKCFFVYLCFNGILSFPRSVFYLVLLGAGILIMSRKTTCPEIKSIVSFFKIFAIILSISIYIQAFLPNLFYPFAERWFYYSSQFELIYNMGIVNHQYSGIFYEVSQASFILSIGCFICFIEGYFKREKRVWNYAFFLIMYFAIVLTGKRSTTLIVAFLILLFWSINNLRKITLWKILGVLLVVMVVLLQIDNIMIIINMLLTKGHESIYLSGREKFWQLAIDLFNHSPIFGTGINSYDVYFNNAGIRSIKYDFAGAHNSYLQMLAETGTIGIVLFMLALFSTMKLSIMRALEFTRTTAVNKTIYCNVAMLEIFFIAAYSLSENPIYMPQQLITLFLFIGFLINLRPDDEYSEGKNIVSDRMET